MAKKKSQTKMVNTIMSQAELVLDPHGATYVCWGEGHEKQVQPLEAKEVTHFISRFYVDGKKKFPSDHIIAGVKKELAFYATERGQFRNIATRVGHHDGAVYFDLGKPGVMRISKDRIKLVEESDILFIKPSNALSLPKPDPTAKNDDVKKLARFLNFSTEDRTLILAWLMSLFMHQGTLPLLSVSGKQGSAKSTALKTLKQTVDPCEAPLIGLPRTEEALFIVSTSYKLMAIDNVSKISGGMSDAMCQLASSGSHTGRKLYTNSELVVIKGRALIGINGIGVEITRPDLLSRTILVDALPLDGRHVTESQLNRLFTKNHPAILGSIIKGVQTALKRHDSITSNSTHRMADLINWSICKVPFHRAS
ncbi:MAG: hypothetical protein KUA35_11915 [Pseudodesulfovibrio sp.]|uniref:ATP-binding protein n=1 Tax=Pseudodesulfovibrio aespoeensis (strain ATCC 700646 / DSM 10631 / Aspo-2) TaxID=643562 RepID=E6VRS2_PSEA9|nr:MULTISPECIES: hypothetical protein [Pseudodesulfovibrio]ADU64209.1 hypothetical protein Daes_3218 [Pseudodesulfovibrio aespoeensis Aspo-2]MBV1765605.1 hypothetical protein [Pseudodesulfovibrio sp.]MBV1773119.1 hypothetical protein [Pseudodesulfovibrio sp.]MCG2731449.1 hypothetical protein [Pseudodesulfovibrio aespoeensis]